MARCHMWQAIVSPRERMRRMRAGLTGRLVAVLTLLLLVGLPGERAAALQSDAGFTPVSGHAQVIAQGVVELPQGPAVWRTVRARAPGSSESTFEARSLGFVFASSGPLLLVDGQTGEQTRL